MIVEIILGVFLLIETYVVWNLFRKTELLGPPKLDTERNTLQLLAFAVSIKAVVFHWCILL